MVYSVGSVLTMVGAGISDERLIKALANPIFPMIAIAVLFVAILAYITYKSSYESKWKVFSVFSIITLSGVAIILFINKYMEKKSKSSYSGGSIHKIPGDHFFTETTTQNTPVPAAAFDDLFSNI